MPDIRQTPTLRELLNSARDALASRNLLRARLPVEPLDAVRVRIGDRELINFASNNYLGLTHHPAIVSAVAESAARLGAGSGASALITGYTGEHRLAEEAIARWKGTESAVLLGSGYQANLAVVQAIVGAAAKAGRGVRFLADKLVHASLIDALRCAEASFRVFPHNHMARVRRLLADASAGRAEELQVVLTESIFSMDGDAADLPALAALRKEFGCVLVVDEAHASGVYGDEGRGLSAEKGLAGQVDISITTFSKALGCVGGAVCGGRALCDAVINFGRSCIYSTSLPPHAAASIRAALEVVRSEPHRLQRLRAVAGRVRWELCSAGFRIPEGDSPIVPILLGSEQSAMDAARSLRDQGLLVFPIRPPTVPRGTSRLRITLSSEHTDQQIAALIAGLCGLPPAAGAQR